ncbi:MAG TPA: hypothetical protein DDX98_14485 [Bacteroidales bacterium]|jgi:hypothetical protein|nr:hypothetical protein [Bacteroidales bacterium]
MTKQPIGLALVLIIALSSCTTGYIVTTNLHDLASFEEKGHFYTLPQTRILVSVFAEKTEFIPGPYHKYAKSYLGIEGAKSLSSFSYNIQDIQLTTQSVPDPDYCYSVRDENYHKVESIITDLQSRGLISKENPYQLVNDNIDEVDFGDAIEFTDLTIKPFFSNELKENSKGNTLTDNDLPLWHKQVKPKTLEEKAQEAALFIFKIRKRRFKLLAGQYDVFPEEQALATSVRELNKLEEEYLALFIGKEVKSTISRTYIMEPDENEKLQRFTLLRFSEETGFHSAGGRIGEAIILQLTDLETNANLTQMGGAQFSAQNNNILLVRLPDRANAKIFYGSYEVLETEIPVYQFGALVPKYVAPVKHGLFSSF